MTKVAILTGAGKGMGGATARELRARGWKVALLSPSGNAEALAKELGGVGVTGSVTEEADLKRLVDAAMTAYGRIDGAVLSTGHPPKGDLLALTDEDWIKG
ncbi:MAG TPA: SDR family NAD(P)-dependent oxidoreductase, partial [Rhabdaerophilum sp.]|nr:SDR family NAD(P)-dependent oxidoreductase [Rhabdaerophilum sp.]